MSFLVDTNVISELRRSRRDALIAATAVVRGLTVVTRNVADFEPMGVALINPWGGLQA